MALNRRQFMTGAAGGAAAAAASQPAVVEAAALMREPKERPANALGLLYDSTLCVGCKACVAACKEANGMPPEVPADLKAAGWNEDTWDTAKDLSGKTLNIIKVYMNGTVETKDQADDGFAFVKRQCLHCVDPSCMSACPVSAMQKDPETGIVSHDPDRCIGCRYCVYACPFGVPKYDYDSAFGQIHKCQLCNHRLPEGKMPACAEVCPTGATLFGRFDDLQKEAHRRLELKPGDVYQYPRGDFSNVIVKPQPPHEKVIEAAYLPEVYGESVLGGTQALYLSAVPFNLLGLPYGEDKFGRKIPNHAYARVTEGIQHFMYAGMVAPLVVLSGLVLLARRNFDRHHHEADETDDGGNKP